MNDKALFSRKPLASAISGIVLSGLAGHALALPSTPEVASGSATVSRPDASTMQINQASQKVVLNYQDFNVGASELVNFVQPGADSVALNRVLGGNPSLILGRLTANGQVFLLNERGVVFGTDAQVSVGGLVAGTMALSDADFLAGNYQFRADGATGSVLNEGDITAADGGYVVLLGNQVENSGVVTANLGSTALLSGENITLDFGGDGLLSYSIDGGVMDSLVKNSGVIQADGGLVVMAGQTAGDLMATVVNNEGLVQAAGLIERDGKIILASNATVVNEGNVTASSSNGDGGSVSASGARVGQFGTMTADGGSAGSGGSVRLDADQVLSLGPTSFTTANAGQDGDGGEVVAFTVGDALFLPGAQIQARGGDNSGNGGFIEVSGINYVQVQGSVDTTAGNGLTGTFLIDPTDIDITSGTTSGVSNVTNTFQSDGSTGSSILNVADLVAALTTSNVTVTTQTGAESLTAPKGADITVLAAITSTSGNDLTLQAGEDISLFQAVDLGAGNLNLQAGVRTDITSGSVLATSLVTANTITASADTSIILTDMSTNSFTGTVNQNGPITVTNNKTLAVSANTTVGNGDISVTTTAGSINVGSINAGTGSVTLKSNAANINASADNTDTEITGAAVILTATTGSIGGTNVLDVASSSSITASTATGVNLDAIGATGTVSVNADVSGTGNITIDHEGAQTLLANTVSAANGNVALTGSNIQVDSVSGTQVEITATGSIEEEAGGDAAVDISATTAELIGAAGIGAGNAIETDIDTLAASASGTISLVNNGVIDINTVDATSGVTTTTSGDISIVANNAITLTQNITSAGAVTLNANTAGGITVAAEDAGADITGTTVTLNSAAGNVGAAAAGGAIDVTASVAVNADVSGSNGNIFIDAVDDIPLGHLNAGTGTVTVNATVSADGRITDGNGATTNITAATATLAADDAIGTLGDGIFAGSNSGNNDALETAVTTFASVVASAANAQINLLDAASPTFTAPIDAGTALAGSALVSVTGNLNTSTVDFADTGDSAGFIATGTLTTPTTLTVAQDLLLNAADITDGALDTDVINATRLLFTSGANETIAASTVGTLDANSTGTGNIVFDANTSAITLADLDSSGAAANTAGNLQVDALGQITVANNLNAGGSVLLNAGTNVLDVNANVTAGTSVTLSQTTDLQVAGGVTINAQNGNADLATAVTGMTLDGTGTVTVQSGGGDNTVNIVGITGTGQNLTISSAGNSTLAAINLGGGDLAVTADSNDDGTTTLLVGGALTNIRNVTLAGGGTGTNDTIDINQGITATGSITVQNAQADVDIAGGLTLDAQGGNLNISNSINRIELDSIGAVNLQTTTADSDVLLGNIASSAAAPLTISSTNGVSLGTVNLNNQNLSVTVDADNDAGTAVTLAVNNISSVANVTLQGAAPGVDEIIDINQSITASGSLTVNNAAEVQILGGATLDAQGGALDISTGIAAVTLDGASGTVTLTTSGTDNDVSVSPLTSAGDNLVVTSRGTANVDTINMGGGDLTISIDTNNNGDLELDIDQAISNAGTILLQGNPTAPNDTIDIDQSITAAGSLSINNSDNVDIAGNLALQGAGVNIQTGVVGTGITLSGASGSTVTITSTGDANTITTAAVAATNNANLTLASEGALTLAGALNLNDGAFSGTVDSDNDGAATLIVNAAPTAGSITLSGGGTGTDDIIDINADLTSRAGGITIQNASDVQIDASAARAITAGTTAAGNLDISNNITKITLDNGASTVTLSADFDSNVTVGSIVDDATGGTAADLVITAQGNVTANGINLADTTPGTVAITVDDDTDAASGNTLTVNGVIQNVATANLQGTGTDDTIDVNANVSSTGALALNNAASVDLAGDIALSGAGVDATTGVTGILLSGADASTVTITSTGDANTVTTAAVTATNNANLTLVSDGNLTIGSSLNINSGTLSATADADGDTGNTLLVSGSPTAGTITLSGGTAGTGDNINIDANVTATAGALTIQNADLVDVAAGLTLQGVSFDASSGVGTVNLSGAGTNTISATGGNATLVRVTDSADASLTISATGTVVTGNVILDDAGAANGNITVTADVDNNSTENLIVTGGAITTNNGAITLSGGTDGNDNLDIDNPITAGGALTLQNGGADIAAGINLTGQSVTANSAGNVSGINLSGAGTNTITSTGGNVDLASVTDTSDASLVVTSTADVTLAGVVLDDAGATNGVLTVTADNDNNTAGSTLAINGAVTVDGNVSLAGGTDNNDTIDINANVTSLAALALANASSADLAANVALRGVSVTANAAGNIGAINLSGVGTNTITATGGNVDISAVTDSADASLTATATGTVNLAAVTLDDAGTVNGNLSVTADSDDASTETVTLAGPINVSGNVTVSAGASNADNDDTIALGAATTLVAGGDITLQNAATIDLDDDVTATGNLTLANATTVDIAAGQNLSGSSVTATSGVTGITLSGAGTNTVTSTSGDVALGAVTSTADANLAVSSEAGVSLAAVTLTTGTGALNVTADSGNDTVGATLLAAGAINTAGATTLAGGTDNNEVIDVDAAIVAGTTLTLDNGASLDLDGNLTATAGNLTISDIASVDVAASLTLTGAGIAANTGVTGINLSGAAGTTVNMTSTGDANTINIAPITATDNSNLTLTSDGALTISQINIGTGTLTATVDNNTGGSNNLTVNGGPTAGAITLQGTGTDDSILINADVNATAGNLLITNAAGVTLAANVDLTGQNVDVATNVTQVTLAGAGENIVTATAGNASLTTVQDSAANASLTVSATGNATLGIVALNNGGTGSLAVTADSDDTGADTLTIGGAVTVDNNVTLSGGSSATDADDIIAIGAGIAANNTASNNGNLTIQNAGSVNITAGNLTFSGAGIAANAGVGTIDLAGAGNTTFDANAGDINLAVVTDSAAVGTLQLDSEGGATLAGITLDGGGASNLVINLDDNGNGATTLDVNGDLLASTITIAGSAATGTETIDLAANVDVSASGGALDLANNIGAIILSGSGTNILTAGGGNASVSAVTDGAGAAANLTVNATGSATLAAITLDTGGAGAVNVTADTDANSAETLTVGGAISATGAIALAGNTDANDTIDVNANITSTGAGVSLSNASAVQVADVTIDAQGGALTVGAAVTLDGAGATPAVFSTSNADNNVTMAAITSAANQSATVTSTGGTTIGGAVALGTGDLVVSVDSDDDAGVTETLAINNTVNADDVTLRAGTTNSRSNITQTAVITANTLTANATNGIALTQNNVVPTVSLTNVGGGNIQYNSDAGATLTVSGSNSVAAGSIAVTEANNGITVGATGLQTNGGTLALTTSVAGQLITLNGAVATNQTAAAGANVTLTADDMNLAGTGGSINAGTGGTVSLVQVTTTDAIDLGAATDATANSLDLSSAELNGITADRLLLGSITAGAVTVSSDVDISNVATTHITTSSTVTGTAGGIVGNDLAINAGGAVNFTDTSSNINNLAVAATGFDVTFVEADGFEVDTVDGVTGINGANVTLTTSGNLGLEKGIAASGNVVNTAAGNISQATGIDVTSTGGSITYQADSDDNATGTITMGIDSNIETSGAAGRNISLTSGTASGGQNITLANVDAGADGNVTVRTYAGSIRDDGRDASVITGDTITLAAAGDVGGSAEMVVGGSKSAALDIAVTGLTGLTSTATAGNNQLMAVDSALLDVEDLLGGRAGAGMTAGSGKQIFIGALDGALEVNTAIDLSDTATKNNDLFLFTGGENRNALINANITLNRSNTDTTKQRDLRIEATGDITQTNSATRLIAYEVEASAPTGNVTLFTGTDQLQSTGGVNKSINLTNDTPANSQFVDANGNPTTRLLEDIITGGTGSITIVNNGSLTVDKNVKTTGTGDISITVSSPLFVESQISSGGAVDLVSAGDADADGVYIRNGGTVQSNSVLSTVDGSIEITAANKIVMDAAAVLSTLAAGSNGAITLTADSNNNVAGTGAGQVDMASGSRATAAGGAPITVSAGGGVALGELNAGVVDASDVAVTARGGGITDANGAALNIIGNAVALTANAGGISTDLIASGSLTANSSTTNGNIDVTSTFGAISLLTANAGTGTVTLVAENGGISDENGDGVVNVTGSTVVLNANGAINSDVEASGSIAAAVQNAAGAAQNGAITLRTAGNMNTGSIAAGTGSVNLTAGGAITDANGAADNVVAGTANITANGGGIDLEVNASDAINATASALAGQAISLASTSGDLKLGSVATNGGTVTLASAGAVSSSGTITGTDLVITAAGNIGSGSNNLGTNVDSLTASTTNGGAWITEADALTLNSLATTGVVNLALGGDLTDANTSGTASITGTTLTITGGNAVTNLDTAVTGLDLDTGATSISNSGDLVLSDSTVTGNLTLDNTGSIAMGNLNASGQAVLIRAGGALNDNNGTGTNLVATSANLSGTGILGLETSLSSLIANATSVSLSNKGALTVSGSNATGLFNLVSDGPVTVTSLTSGSTTITSGGDLSIGAMTTTGIVVLDTGAVIRSVGSGQQNVQASALQIRGGATVAGLKTRVGTMTLTTGDTAISNIGPLTLGDSRVTGEFSLTNDNSLTVNNLAVTGNAEVTTIAQDIVLGSLSVTGTLKVDADGSILDGNGSANNITAVVSAALSAGVSVGTLADAIEVQVGGVLSLPAAGADTSGVSANIAGLVGGGIEIGRTVPGFVLFDPNGRGSRPIGGGNYNLVASALAGELQIFEGGMHFTHNFQFEGFADSMFSTGSAETEIEYGKQGELKLIEVEDILTSPMSSADFDRWIDGKMQAALAKLGGSPSQPAGD